MSRYTEFAPPGHFYSPLPDPLLVDGDFDRVVVPARSEIPGIVLNASEQLGFLKQIAIHFPGWLALFDPDSPRVPRYRASNDFFCLTDAMLLHACLRTFRPRSIIEVGSGYSSAVMLDTKEFWAQDFKLTFLEPFPDRLASLLRPVDLECFTLLSQPAQTADPAVFLSLGDSDILFVDSSHVSKFGSDVNFLVFEILPLLQKGVVVHIHDIFWPFEYPLRWHKEGRAWNEAYIIRAFLAGNMDYEVLLFPHFLFCRHLNLLTSISPNHGLHSGGSLWLRKVR